MRHFFLYFYCYALCRPCKVEVALANPLLEKEVMLRLWNPMPYTKRDESVL